MLTRRRFLCALGIALPLVHRRAEAQSATERLIAAMQDGGKVIYLRHAADDHVREARELGRALRALRVPLNEILASSSPGSRLTAELAFGDGRVRVTEDLPADDSGASSTATIAAARRLLRTSAGPGMNRVLVGLRRPLERAAGRRFPDSVLPEGAMAVFVPGDKVRLLGTLTTGQVLASAEARGALAKR